MDNTLKPPVLILVKFVRLISIAVLIFSALKEKMNHGATKETQTLVLRAIGTKSHVMMSRSVMKADIVYRYGTLTLQKSITGIQLKMRRAVTV